MRDVINLLLLDIKQSMALYTYRNVAFQCPDIVIVTKQLAPILVIM